MKKNTFFVGLLFAFGAIVACSKSSSSGTSTTGSNCDTTISFSKDVSPIITSSCATNSSCHASGSSQGPGALTTYTQIYNNRTSIASSVANGSMPKGSSLTATQKTLITCWVSNGAKNN